MKLFTLIACACMLTLMVAGCNTVEGAGEDLQAGGRAVENAAQDAKN